MKVMNPIDLARQALAPASAESEDEQRVLQLFRNRAELKKAYNEIQDEIHRLKDRLKQQEGATARVQEMLEALEGRLQRPETAYPTMVFYQLRGLWAAGSAQLRTFGDDLEKQFVERERRAFVAETNRRQFARRQEAQDALLSAEGKAAEAIQRCHALERTRASLTRPWHHFRRRRLDKDIERARLNRSATEGWRDSARDAFDAIQAGAEVAFPGLSVEARREVNLSVIAFAETLALRLAGTALLVQARAAVLQREVSDEYGTREECEALIAEIARARALIEQKLDPGQELRLRSDKLVQMARYRSDEDTIPAPESLMAAPVESVARTPRGMNSAQLPNVLGEDTFELFRVLLR
jgi:hypothetical protein